MKGRSRRSPGGCLRPTEVLLAAVLLAGVPCAGSAGRAHAAARAVVAGAVVDTSGVPVSGATVLLNNWQDDIPVGVGGGAWPTFTAVTDERGHYEFGTTAELDLWCAAGFIGRLRAVRGDSVSEQQMLTLGDKTVRAEKLIVEAGRRVLVTMQRPDGPVIAEGLSVVVQMLDRTRAGHDDRSVRYSLACESSGEGQYVSGLIPEREYSDFLVTASGVEGLSGEFGASQLQIQAEGLTLRVRVMLARRRTVVGQVMTASGVPAVGYRVAPWRKGGAAVAPGASVLTDGLGRFVLEDSSGDHRHIAVYNDDGDSFPLLLASVRASSNAAENLGTLRLPTLRTMGFKLATANGAAVRGKAFLFRADVLNASRAKAISPTGVVAFDGVPSDSDLTIRVEADDEQHGGLIQEFQIPAGSPLMSTLTVSGRGMIVVRFVGSTGPVPVTGLHLRWGLEPMGEGSWPGRVSEVRQWLGASGEIDLEIQADQMSPRTLRRIRIHRDGPTVVEVRVDR